ncbi:branched-subunit amino acid transport protein AzlD [Streptohalobacillus salinus]|uniref:Branched-subunit amino acid transport protein AzlD n=1 Tax=Streptohalobacillus salinus TaxID=621096 RepID=A0A2V3WDQ8_9BACI|nr:AzlD domain-containing protein [Streptohalobacillus salinus]PXW93056.1 branched-subunit amino acid transport protein AzlD [Streptohalobacillus salinus]
MPVLLLVSLFLVTVIPRILPAFLMDRMIIPKRLTWFLEGIPYAILGALIFPGILTVVQDRPWIGVGAGLVATVLSLVRVPLVLVVLLSVSVVYLLL